MKIDERPEPKFKVGQIVVVTGLKKQLPFRILSMMWNNGWFYAWNRRNYAAEHMIRKLTADEIGTLTDDRTAQGGPGGVRK